MFCNSLISIVILVPIVIISDGLMEAATFEYLWVPGFLVSLLGSCLMAFVLNYAIFWNTLVNSPLTQNVSGQAKDIFTVVISYFLFHTTLEGLGCLNLFGICIGFAGGCLYVFAKWKQR
eukprot:TRINITY_DN20809_c0_g1_i1.p1 TRINITY_DN20809_c0_g1~~TRINITY_DN20809_c0_g1_i1.p1  ORF type:complete len:119 (-),score=18.51 TRINITY_DN20809_c0_g1_i1:121-477(-)